MKNIFDQLKHFVREENWGNADMMNHDLLFELDALRKDVGSRIIISYGTQGKHSKNSQHPRGLAVDVMCPAINIFDFYLHAEQFNFTGLGIYSDWRFSGMKVGGLHLDLRSLPPHFSGARWVCCAGKYYALTGSNLKKFKII